MYCSGMNRFEVVKELPRARAFVRGEYKDLYPGDEVIVYKGDREWRAVVETRTGGGAVVRVVLEN